MALVKAMRASSVLLGVLLIQGISTQRYKSQDATYLLQQKSNRDNRQTSLNFNCPEKNGRYPINTCDGYIECLNGVPEQKLCSDGLLFNAAASPFSFPCQYPLDVDCTGREATQPAQPTEDCPHQFGYYKIGDSESCGQFKNCVDGRAFIFDCPEGLAWNEESYRCDWPDEVKSCDAEAYLGFKCPKYGNTRGLGEEEYRSFRSPNDCQRYYVCVNQSPRMFNCGEGNAYNDLINACDGAENVTGCAGVGNFDVRSKFN